MRFTPPNARMHGSLDSFFAPLVEDEGEGFSSLFFVFFVSEAPVDESPSAEDLRLSDAIREFETEAKV